MQRETTLESKETNTLKTITANQAQTHFGDIIRQVIEDGDPIIIVERAGEPQVAVVSLADLERLCGPMDGEPSSTSDTTKADWWDEFERELHDLPVE